MFAFVIMRDRWTYADQCVSALIDAGLEPVVVNHASRYPDAVQWLHDLADLEIPAWHDENRHPRDLWRPGGPIEYYMTNHANPGDRFIVTDCDVVPDPDCPGDWLTALNQALNARPVAVKAGLGLRTDNLPEHFVKRSEVQEWEATYQPPVAATVRDPHDTEGLPPAVWADIDTTLAMYRRFEPFRLGPAIRTTAPYWARHLAWYEDTANPTPEQAYYRKHARFGHWRAPDGFHDEHGLDAH